MATENTLRIREAAREAARPTVALAVRVQAVLRPNANRILYCEACRFPFAETEAFEGPGGWSICPNCGSETA